MKHLKVFLLVAAALVSSCSSQKRVWYLQDAAHYAPESIGDAYQIRIKPLDRLTIVVNSKDPELAAPFNTTTSLNSLSGTPIGMGQANSATALQIRTVDEDGYLDMPIIGRIECKGKTRNELAESIADKIKAEGYISDPMVNVQFADMKFSVIGEVAHPGQFNITQDRISVLDALAMAGDMTIYGIRTDVIVARENNGIRTIEHLDLTSKNLFRSPYYYLQQNDVVYVKPNKYRTQSSEISQNRSFYISLVATAVSVATLIVTITK